MKQYEQRTEVPFSAFLKERGMGMIPVRHTSLRLQSQAETQPAQAAAAKQDDDDEAIMDAD